MLDQGNGCSNCCHATKCRCDGNGWNKWPLFEYEAPLLQRRFVSSEGTASPMSSLKHITHGLTGLLFCVMMQEVRAGCRLIELTASGHKSDTDTPPVNCQLCLVPRIQLDPLVEFRGKVDGVIGCKERRKIVPYLIHASKCNRSSVSQDDLPYK